MDPLTAISLASCVVQFTDFGIKIVSSAIKLYYSANGLDDERSDLAFRATHLRKLADKLAFHLNHNEDDGQALVDQQELRALVISCQKIASDLFLVLDDFKVKKPSGSGRRWESFQKAVASQTPWNKDKVATLEKSLRSRRQEMFDRIQIMMSDKQSQTLLTLKDLADVKLLQMRNSILDKMEDAKTETDGAMADLSSQLLSLAEASREQKILRILDSLDFETRQSRQSDIADIESRTFEWIFHDHHGPTSRPVGLRNWLQSGNDIYWISGIAGSGKSVLMNYLANEPRTQAMLQSWAGDTRLILAKYFFWNAGAPMQKSQQGLLQSLLREIYGQRPELVPIVCPRWNRYYDIGATWTRQELSESFKKLRQKQGLDIKICFFIDGMDEYDGEDHAHIINVLKDLNASASVKICLSSRPWNIFVAAFGADTNQRLSLEDHNEGDIQIYINQRFQSEERFALLQAKDPGTSKYLVDYISRNAQGVFLWVGIIVSNLLGGLKNDDSLLDLRRRVESFPTSLADYFQHMFDSIDDFYQRETAEILLIYLQGIQPFSLLNLWCYEEEKTTPEYALRAIRRPLSKGDIIAIFQKIDKRINARAQGLLVVETDAAAEEYLMYTVRFSHQTVKDFLMKPDMVARLRSWRSSSFNAEASLCKATLAIIKSLPSADHNEYTLVNKRSVAARVVSSSWKKLVGDFFAYAQLVEKNQAILDTALIDELQQVVVTSFTRPMESQTQLARFLAYLACKALHWIAPLHEVDVSRTDAMLQESPPDFDRDMTVFFFAWAIEANLKRYIEDKLATKPHIARRSLFGRPMLDRALRESIRSPPPNSSFCRTNVDMVRLLLNHGADPNEELTVWSEESGCAWTTVWALYLKSLYNVKLSGLWKPHEIVQEEIIATRLLIEHGAAADLRPWRILPLKERFGSRMLTPSDIFPKVFPARDAIVLDKSLRDHRPWALRRACACLRRTALLWFYRDIQITIRLLDSVIPIFFNNLLGVILPFLLIEVVAYCIWQLWPFISFVISGVTPVLLPALILSDWVPLPQMFMR